MFGEVSGRLGVGFVLETGVSGDGCVVQLAWDRGIFHVERVWMIVNMSALGGCVQWSDL